MNKGSSFLLMIFLLSTISHTVYGAPGVDVTVKISKWQTDYSGDLGQGTDTATLEELGFIEEDFGMQSITIDHALPVVPNIKIQNTDLSSTGTGTLTRDLIVDGTTFTVSDTLNTSLDLSHTDFTFFYSPINNWVHFDLGLTARHFTEGLSVEGASANTAIDLEEWLPMIYGNLRFELPLTGVYINSDLNYASYEDNTLSDFSASLGYVSDSAVSFTAEVGYRKFSIDAEDINNFEADIDIDGIYASIGLVF